VNIGIFEDFGYKQLLPLTWLRPCYELRCGRDRLIDKLRAHLSAEIHGIWVRDALREVALERIELAKPDPGAGWCLVNARLLLTNDVLPPPVGVGWSYHGDLLALSISAEEAATLDAAVFRDEFRLSEWLGGRDIRPAPEGLCALAHPWDIVHANGAELHRQCNEGGVLAGEVSPGAHLLNPRDIHIAAGARIKPGVVLDAENGPIHVDRDVLIQPNAVIEGPCCIGPRSIIRPTAVLRSNTTIGPVCRVGGEIEATVFQGYSNKQHDGFLGHSFVAEWVNLGAATVTSDLKNTYGTIRVSINGVPVETGQHFVGATIGDHAKTGIGTILPTGGVIGVAANVFTQSAVPKFVPSFAWLTTEGMTAYQIEKAIRIARTVMARRDVHLTDAEVRLLEHACQLAREVEAAGWAAEV
jgi:UDP-N-acetylglucosamine diphosphorylase/glucosamine-1-phosphate N-acetyltransferase